MKSLSHCLLKNRLKSVPPAISHFMNTGWHRLQPVKDVSSLHYSRPEFLRGRLGGASFSLQRRLQPAFFTSENPEPSPANTGCNGRS
jgi:hypothetical protein